MQFSTLQARFFGHDKGPMGEAADEVVEMIRSNAPHLPSSLTTFDQSPDALPQQLSRHTKKLRDIVLQSPTAIAFTTLGAATAAYGIYRRYFRRIPTAAYITPSTMRWRRMLVGRCVSVGDADGFRFYHTPGPPLYRSLMYGRITAATGPGSGTGKGGATFSASQTISVRLAGADAPESGHFGKPSQPFSKEAKAELEGLVLGREVYIQPAHIDQYQRLVATPYVWRPPYFLGRTNVSLHLVKSGLATVYTQSGAAYGTAGPFARFVRWTLGLNKDEKATAERTAKTALLDRIVPMSGEARLRRAESRAKRQRRGMWSQKKVETPEEYKKRTQKKA